MDKKLLWLGLAVGGVIITAIGFRFYDLQNYPPGLWPDVAANGEDALLILEGDRRPFFPRGNGREGLLFYLDALSIKYFGLGVWQMYVPTTTVGVLTVIATYFATQAFFGRLAGVLAGLFAATSYWHVTLSRTGFRAILAPLFLAAFTAFVGYAIRAAHDGRRVWSYVYAALAGVALAGGFYAYISYRAMVGVIAGVAVLLLLAAMHKKIGFPHFRRYGGQMVVGVVAASVVASPLAWYFSQHPAEFMGRAGQVSIFSQDLQRAHGLNSAFEALAYSTRETVKGFFVGQGDLNWRHSVAGYPLLNPLVGLLFLVGVVWAIWGLAGVIWHMVQGREVHLGMIYAYLLLMLAGMLAGVVTTLEGIPHGLRAAGAFFPIMMLAGTVGAVIVHYIQRRLVSEQARAVGYGITAGALIAFSVFDGALYFFVARNEAEAYSAYRGDLTEVAEFITGNENRPYLVLDAFSVQTVHFLQHEIAKSGAVSPPPHDFESHPDEEAHRYRLLKPEVSHEVKIGAGEVIIFTQSTLPDAGRYVAGHPSIELVESRANRFGQEIMRVYRGTKGQSAPLPTAPQEPTFDLDAE